MDAAPGRRARRADPAAGRQPGQRLGAELPSLWPAGPNVYVASSCSAWPGAANAHRQIADLVRVGVAVGDGSSEDRRVGCDPRYATVTGELGTAPRSAVPGSGHPARPTSRLPAGWRANLSSGPPSIAMACIFWPCRRLGVARAPAGGAGAGRAEVCCVRPDAAVDVPDGTGDAAGSSTGMGFPKVIHG
jgi:hypothetical protein